MKTYIDYFFYRIYIFNKNSDEMPLFKTKLVLVIILFLYLLNISALLEHYVFQNKRANLTKPQIYFIGLVLFVIIHLLYPKKKVLQLEDIFSIDENRKRNGWIVVSGMVLPFVIFIILTVMKHHL